MTGALLAVGLLAAAPAQAAGSATVGQMFVLAGEPTTFYSYLEADDTLKVSFLYERRQAAHAERLTITDPNGVVRYTCDFPTTAVVGARCDAPDLGGAGVWTIRMERISAENRTPRAFAWQIDVIDGGGATVPGRTWTHQYTITQPSAGDPPPPADLDFWLVNDTGYRYAVGLNGYHGIYSTISANALGVGDADCVPIYRSVAIADIGPGGLRTNCDPLFRVFFGEPAADLPASAQAAEGVVFIAPTPLLEADLVVNDLTFTPAAPASAAGTFAYSINPRFTGAHELQIDTDGNGSYADPVDRIITRAARGTAAYTYAFDGLDGTGAAIADCTPMNARIYYGTVGEMHVLQSDVEGRSGGIEITRLNGDDAPNATIYWDDTQITDPRENTTPVLDGTAGQDSSAGVHGWPFATNSWGDNTFIDDWTFVPLEFGTGEIAVGGFCLDIEKSSDATADTRVGDTVTYEVTATNIGSTDYTVSNPASVTDDLTGVLDDGDYNADVTADQPGTLAYAEPKISWTGALAAGDTVTLNYTVTLTGEGDGVARNVAYGADPGVPTPGCAPPDADGIDPATGLPCAEHIIELPSLSIEKSADVAEVPAVGTTVTYTVVATNDGPGAFTAGAPAVVVDDLTGILDDASFDEASLDADLGSAPTYTEPQIRWEGALAAGQSVTITYAVTYTGAGDAELRNVAWSPEDPTDPTPPPPSCDPRDADGLDPVTGEACDLVVIPAARLEVTKSVDPEDGTVVGAGDSLTYTLTFANDGTAAASVVDWTDDLTGVLDDARLTAGPVSSSTDLTAAYVAGLLTIDGSVPAGGAVTITYTVEVLPDADRGDDVLVNFLFADAPPAECVEGDPLCTVNEAPQPPGDLAVTGGQLVPWMWGTAVALLVGTGLLLAVRRRRSAERDVEVEVG